MQYKLYDPECDSCGHVNTHDRCPNCRAETNGENPCPDCGTETRHYTEARCLSCGSDLAPYPCDGCDSPNLWTHTKEEADCIKVSAICEAPDGCGLDHATEYVSKDGSERKRTLGQVAVAAVKAQADALTYR